MMEDIDVELHNLTHEHWTLHKPGVMTLYLCARKDDDPDLWPSSDWHILLDTGEREELHHLPEVTRTQYLTLLLLKNPDAFRAWLIVMGHVCEPDEVEVIRHGSPN